MLALILKILKKYEGHKEKCNREKRELLPHEISSHLVDAEIQCETNPSRESITALVYLYKRSLEYYEEQDNPKYRYFQRKIKEALQNKDFQRIISDGDPQIEHEIQQSEFLEKTICILMSPHYGQIELAIQEKPTKKYTSHLRKRISER